MEDGADVHLEGEIKLHNDFFSVHTLLQVYI